MKIYTHDDTLKSVKDLIQLATDLNSCNILENLNSIKDLLKKRIHRKNNLICNYLLAL